MFQKSANPVTMLLSLIIWLLLRHALVVSPHRPGPGGGKPFAAKQARLRQIEQEVATNPALAGWQFTGNYHRQNPVYELVVDGVLLAEACRLGMQDGQPHWLVRTITLEIEFVGPFPCVNRRVRKDAE